ncbi:hypothetical protein ACJX0J_007846, partial [Zea mays]
LQSRKQQTKNSTIISLLGPSLIEPKNITKKLWSKRVMEVRLLQIMLNIEMNLQQQDKSLFSNLQQQDNRPESTTERQQQHERLPEAQQSITVQELKKLLFFFRPINISFFAYYPAMQNGPKVAKGLMVFRQQPMKTADNLFKTNQFFHAFTIKRRALLLYKCMC